MLEPFRLEGDIHVVVETEVARYLRRLLHDDNIFIYYHAMRKLYVVARWISKSGGAAAELFPIVDLGDPDEVREAVEIICASLSPDAHYAAQAWKAEVRSKARAGGRGAQEDADYRADMLDWLRRNRARSAVYSDHPAWGVM